jgi:hypothetical protein
MTAVGNVLSLGSYCFLVGPERQCKGMFAPERRNSTIAYLGSLVATLVCIFYLRCHIPLDKKRGSRAALVRDAAAVCAGASSSRSCSYSCKSRQWCIMRCRTSPSASHLCRDYSSAADTGRCVGPMACLDWPGILSRHEEFGVITPHTQFATRMEMCRSRFLRTALRGYRSRATVERNAVRRFIRCLPTAR